MSNDIYAQEPLPPLSRREAQAIRKRVKRFAAMMEAELIANRHKGSVRDWANLDGIATRNEILYHVAKAAFAAKHGNRAGLREFLVDCANCALMSLDAEGLLP